MIFIFTYDSNYGEFVKVVKADTAEEARHICPRWYLDTIITGTENDGILFEGGGDPC